MGLPLALLCLFAGIFAGATVGRASAAASSWSEAPADASSFVASVNATRAANGLPALSVDGNMTSAALGWAAWMAENDTLAHAGDILSGAPSDWTKVGENVGRGGSVNSVWNAFMASPSHAANVLDPAYTRVGIAVVWTTDGMLYTTHRFAGAQSDVAPAPTPAPTATPAPAPTATPVPEPTTPPDDNDQRAAPDPTPTAAPTTRPATPSSPTPPPATPTPAPDPPFTLAFDNTEPVAPVATADRIETTMTLLLHATG